LETHSEFRAKEAISCARKAERLCKISSIFARNATLILCAGSTVFRAGSTNIIRYKVSRNAEIAGILS